jgi:hypothetical protein
MTPESPPGRVWPLVAAGSVLVAVTTPLNLVLILLCWHLVGAAAGSSAANNTAGLTLLSGAVNVGLFLALCDFALREFCHGSVPSQRVAIVVVLVIHLGLWLGLSFALVANMAATGVWM